MSVNIFMSNNTGSSAIKSLEASSYPTFLQQLVTVTGYSWNESYFSVACLVCDYVIINILQKKGGERRETLFPHVTSPLGQLIFLLLYVRAGGDCCCCELHQLRLDLSCHSIVQIVQQHIRFGLTGEQPCRWSSSQITTNRWKQRTHVHLF